MRARVDDVEDETVSPRTLLAASGIFEPMAAKALKVGDPVHGGSNSWRRLFG